MFVKTYFGGSCAVSAIHQLGDHKNAVEALQAFCRQELGERNEWTPYATLGCYYAFSAGPEVPRDHPNGSHHSKAWTRYGTEFAQFITENALGEIVTLGPKFNAKHHKNSTAQVWMWSPNQRALEAWWRAQQ